MTTSRLAIVSGLAVIYAVCYAAIKTGLEFAPPLSFAGLRALIAAAGLFVGIILTRQPVLPPRKLWPWVIALAAIGTTAAYGAMFYSPLKTGVGIASVLGNTGPLMIVVLSAVVLKEALTRAKVMALALGLAGVAAIYYPTFGQDSHGTWGTILPLIAAACLALESVIFKRANVGSALPAVAAWQFLIGSIPLIALASFFERGEVIEWNFTFVTALLFLSLVGTALAISVWYWLVQRSELGRLSLLLFLVPVMGLAVGYVLFREPIGVSEFTGIALIVGGLAVLVAEPGGTLREQLGQWRGSRRLRARSGRDN